MHPPGGDPLSEPETTRHPLRSTSSRCRHRATAGGGGGY
jgi:hypothetical protein